MPKEIYEIIFPFTIRTHNIKLLCQNERQAMVVERRLNSVGDVQEAITLNFVYLQTLKFKMLNYFSRTS